MTRKAGGGAGRGLLIAGAAFLLLFLLCAVPAVAAAGAGDGGNGTAGIWGPYLTAMDATSVQVRWHGDGVTGVLCRPAGSGVWEEVPPVPAGEGFWYVQLSNLSPSSSYKYRLAGEDGGPYRFTTFPPEGPVTFAVVGDTQDDPTVPIPDGRTPLVAEAIAEDEDCMFLLHLGDTVGDPHDEAEWERFFAEMGPVMSQIPIFPVMGNHERNLTVWYAAFGYPEWYAFSCGDVPVIVLDSNDWAAPRAEEQDAWLEKTLAVAECPPVVAFHHPPFADDAKHPDGWRQFADRWEPLFTAYDVPLVLSGHVHAYERYERDGRVWIVAGTGGGPLYPLTEEKGEGCIVAVERTIGYLRIDSEGGGRWSGAYIAAGKITADGGMSPFDEPHVMDRFALPAAATPPVPATGPNAPENTPSCPVLPAAGLMALGILGWWRSGRHK
jgi:predicted phosphodiesterase